MRRALVRIAVAATVLAAGPALAHHSALHFGGSAAELLEPEKAFAMSARALDARTVEVRFAIADGYYMYRERFRFVLEEGAQGRLDLRITSQGCADIGVCYVPMDSRASIQLVALDAAAPGTLRGAGVVACLCAWHGGHLRGGGRRRRLHRFAHRRGAAGSMRCRSRAWRGQLTEDGG